MKKLLHILLLGVLFLVGCSAGAVTQSDLTAHAWDVYMSDVPDAPENIPLFEMAFDETNVQMDISDAYIDVMVDESLAETGLLEVAEEDESIREEMRTLAEELMQELEMTASYEVEDGNIRFTWPDEPEDSYAFTPMERDGEDILIREWHADGEKTVGTAVRLVPKQ